MNGFVMSTTPRWGTDHTPKGELLEKQGVFQNNVIEVKVDKCYEKEHLVKHIGLFNMKSDKKEEEESFLETSSYDC